MCVRCQDGAGVGLFLALIVIMMFKFLWANHTPMHLALSLGILTHCDLRVRLAIALISHTSKVMFEIDVFLELSCFFHGPADVGNLICGSSAFSKTSLNIWNFMAHVLLKPGWEITLLACEMSAIVW